jgi:hypothetical protein
MQFQHAPQQKAKLLLQAPREICLSFLMLSCQNSIIDQDSFSMLQTDTLRFTQIAQTIDKLVFHLAGEKELGKKLIQLRKKGKFQLKEREEKTIFCRFLNGKNLPFEGSEGRKEFRK